MRRVILAPVVACAVLVCAQFVGIGFVLMGPPAVAAAAEQPAKLAARVVDAAEKLNEWHAKNPGRRREQVLAAKLPETVPTAVARLVRAEDSAATREALVAAGQAALDIDWMPGFEPIAARLRELDPERAKTLGLAVSRERFLVRGIGGVEPEMLENFADVLDGVLDQYDRTFGFVEWSKVPGKKLRVRVHLEDRITRPPHFAPQFRFHSEIDFPVVDPTRFTSPTDDGKFLFYGLCHELGHVIAMWGDGKTEEDHHAWAHYTGVVIVEALANAKRKPKWLDDLRDVRWRSVEKEKDRLDAAGQKPSTRSRDGVLALIFALHDAVGPAAIGAAINQLDEKGRSLRINDVRYYTFAELREGLLAVAKGKKQKKAVKRLLEQSR